jgi:hypothetical protein
MSAGSKITGRVDPPVALSAPACDAGIPPRRRLVLSHVCDAFGVDATDIRALGDPLIFMGPSR